MHCIEVEGGTHREMGRCIGEALSERIIAILEELKIPDSYSTAGHERMRGRLRANLSKQAPHLLEEMEGIAEGAKLPFNHILTYNVIAEMWRVKEGCTAVGFCDAPEGVVVGKTNDIGEGKEHYHVGHRFTFPNGRRALIFTWPGTVWLNAGVNDDGLVLGGASVPSAAMNEKGLPANALQRLVLEQCISVDEAVEFCRDATFMCHPFNIVVGDVHDRLVGIERDVYAMSVREPKNGAVFVTNHWASPELRPLCTATPDVLENSRHRFSNLERLVKELPHTLKDMMELLKDHAKPGAICQHGDDPAKMHTSVAYVMVPRERAIYFAYGKPCRVPFERLFL